MQLSDFTNLDSRTRSLVRRALEKWNPRVEARVIELFNEGLSQSDVNKIITREGIFKFPSSIGKEGGARKFDYRGVNAIYQKLFEDGKLDPSITEINKAVSGKYATGKEIAIQDKQILDHSYKLKDINPNLSLRSADKGWQSELNVHKNPEMKN